MNNAQIDNIENRLLGAVKWPWNIVDGVVQTASRASRTRAARTSCINPGELDDDAVRYNKHTIDSELQIAKRGLAADKDTMVFIAKAPTDIEALLNTVRAQTTIIEQQQERRTADAATVLQLGSELASARSELEAIRKTVAAFKSLVVTL